MLADATTSTPNWHAPVKPLQITRSFRAVAPFAAGGRRTISLRAAPGAAVRAPCTGRVRFAGRVAGGPQVLTLRCGGWNATLSRVDGAYGLGAVVRAGALVGRATSATLGLSARDPSGTYRDPAPLLGREAQRPPGAPARRRMQRPRWTAPEPAAPAKLPSAALVPEPSRHAARAPRTAPGQVELPLGMLGLGVGSCGLLLLAARRVRRSESRSRPAVAHRIASRR